MHEPTDNDDLFRKIGIAMREAAQAAREHARRWRVPLVVVREGKIVEIPPDEIEDRPGVALPLRGPR